MTVLAEIHELTIQYGKRVAVDALDLALDAGEIALLLGPNGAGKSTTLAAIAGTVLPSGGTIAIAGEDLARAPRSARAKVGFADQPPALYEYFTVEEHVTFIAEARGSTAAAATAMLAKLGLEKISARPCRELSFGMRQRVGLAAALVGPVEVALLDETLNGLDPHAARAARTTLRAFADAGAAILMSTHLLGVAERLCDRVLVMNKGKLVADKRGADVKALLAGGPQALEELYVSLIADEGPTCGSTDAAPNTAGMTGAAFRRWERVRTARERGSITRWVIAVVFGGLLAALVAWRATDSVASASHAWLAGAVAAFMVAFMRVPFHVYWRPDAPLLAQLPIAGSILFKSAVRRCIVAATTTLVTVVVGALPFAALSEKAVAVATRTLDAMPFAGDPVPRETPFELFARHAGYGVAFALVAATFIPAVTMYAASLVAGSRNLLQIATALGGAPARTSPKSVGVNPAHSSAGAVLGALPGLASSAAIVVLLLASPWLLNKDAPIAIFPAAVLVGGISVFSLVGAGAKIGPRMGDILRDVSALDRQRLATLEIHPPTAIERGVMKLLGAAAALAYSKDARLMRRRYPMAYALGAIIFLVLAIIGFSQPADPVPWLVVPLAGALLYAILLRARLSDAPIELTRLSDTLPIAPAARRLAKRAWIAGWLTIFLLVPTAFAVVRTLI